MTNRRLLRWGIPAVIVAGFVVVVWWWCWGPTTTLLVVRHADRLATDALSPLGVARAQVLVHVVEKAGISAIYVSDTDRARQTAAPLATALGLTPVELAAADVTALVNDIFTNHRGQTVLVVGHSNTVPQIIAAAGGPALAGIPDNEFDNLFVLTLCRCRWLSARLTHLQYGAVSP